MTCHLTCVYTQICSVMFGDGYTYILGDGARRVVCVQSMQGACHLACVYTQMCSVLLCLLDAIQFAIDGARFDVYGGRPNISSF